MTEQVKKVDVVRAQQMAKGLHAQGHTEAAAVLADLVAGYKELVEVAQAQRDWIDAVPGDLELPVMPGFDRDWSDGVIAGYIQSLGE